MCGKRLVGENRKGKPLDFGKMTHKIDFFTSFKNLSTSYLIPVLKQKGTYDWTIVLPWSERIDKNNSAYLGTFFYVNIVGPEII